MPVVSLPCPSCRISRCRGRWTYVIERAELGGGLVQAGVGREDRAATLALVANNPTHDDGVVLLEEVDGELFFRGSQIDRVESSLNFGFSVPVVGAKTSGSDCTLAPLEHLTFHPHGL